jgi:hypothetical protein
MVDITLFCLAGVVGFDFVSISLLRNRIYENKNLPTVGQVALVEPSSPTHDATRQKVSSKRLLDIHTTVSFVVIARSLSALLDAAVCSPAQTPRGKFRRTTKSRMPRGNYWTQISFLRPHVVKN